MAILRHIIVEGPDGSGKTNLVVRLTESFGFPIHPRASHSKDGPIGDMDAWAEEDVYTMADQPPSVYDRHPIISESIYAVHARHTTPHGRLANPGWRAQMLHRAAQHAILIICLPPHPTVIKNVMATKDEQMPGVLDAIDTIYDEYRRVWDLWPGYAMWWNYTTNYTGAGYAALLSDTARLLRGVADVQS